MPFQTVVHVRLQRANRKQCGIKTAFAPWANNHSRFTLLLEAFAIDTLTTCGNVKRVAKLLRIHWQTAHAIMERSV